MNNLETNKNTSPKAEATTPAFPISPAIPQLQCRVRDFVAASQYAASPVEGSSVGRTVSGDVWLSGISRWLYNDIIDQITIKTSTTGTKVAQLNGKEFFQNEIGFSAETAIFPIEELCVALNQLPQTSQPRRTKVPRSLRASCIVVWPAIVIILAILSHTTFASLLISILVAIPIACATAALANEIRQLDCNKNIFCKALSWLFSQKHVTADYEKIRQEILTEQDTLLASPNAIVQAFLFEVKQHDTSDNQEDKAKAKKNAHIVIAVLMGILSTEFKIPQSDIASHIETLNQGKSEKKSLRGLQTRTIERLFSDAQKTVIEELLPRDPALQKLIDKTDVTKVEKVTGAATQALHKEVYRRLSAGFQRKKNP